MWIPDGSDWDGINDRSLPGRSFELFLLRRFLLILGLLRILVGFRTSKVTEYTTPAACQSDPQQQGFALVPRRYGKAYFDRWPGILNGSLYSMMRAAAPPKLELSPNFFGGTLKSRNVDQKTWKPKWSIP